MFCDIDQATIQAAALKAYGPGVQVGLPMYIDTLSESICVAVTPYQRRSFHARFYYLKGSFDQKAENLL
jgi:hypothetical protein